MPHTVIMPKLGQTVEESAIVKWHKQVGDTVQKGDVLFEIETDKAVLEAESFYDGTLLKIVVPENVPVPVRSVVAYIGESGESVPDTPPPAVGPAKPEPEPTKPEPPKAASQGKQPQTESPQPPSAAEPAAPVAAPPVQPVTPRPAVSGKPATPKRLIISPRARALARDAAIDPSSIEGSGPNGRIVEKDVRAWMDGHDYDKLRVAPAARKLARERNIDLLSVRGSGDGGRILTVDIERAERCKPVAMPRIRQVIAQRLSESFATIPHFYVTVTADMTDLMRLRTERKAEGLSYSVNDFVLQATVLALEEMPAINSRTDGQSIAWNGDVDLGVAVSLDRGLVVPVVRAAQLLSMRELSDRVRALAQRARDGKLTPDEMSGSSFTVSNMGMLDIDQFNAIINPGEAGILAVASIREAPAVADGRLVVRQRMTLTLSADHRIVDGATGAAFVNAIKQKLEDLALWKSLTLS